MSDKLWNNQGGSDFHGGSKKKDRIKKPEDPFKRRSLDELKESEVTSFRLVKQRKALPHYGDFGDAVWMFDLIPDDDIRDLEAPQKFRDLSTTQPTEAKPFRDIEDIRDVPTDKNSDLSRPIKSLDLIPYSVSDEYELIVKFKKVILTISSGQAFAARNRINDPKYDRSIVIQSTQPIILNTSIFIIEQNTTPRTVNIIQLKNGFQDPVFSLYNWMLTKIKIITDNTGKNPDNELLALSRQNGITELPRTVFSYNDKDYGLFYAPEGIQPYQVCMHARDDVLKFVAGNPKDDRYWSVLNSNTPLSLCTPNVPTVSVRLAPGSASELEAGSGMSFVLDVVVEPDQEIETLVEFETLGSANPGLYTVTGTSLDVDNIPVVNIPIANDKQVFVEPSANPGQTGNRSIIFKLKENDRYLIEDESVTLTVLPKVGIKIDCICVRFRTAIRSDRLSAFVRTNISGSNTSTNELGETYNSTSFLFSKLVHPSSGRAVLIDQDNQSSFIDTYGTTNNYQLRSFLEDISVGAIAYDFIQDTICSKQLLKDWALSVGVRYATVSLYTPLFFDRSPAEIPTSNDPNPSPPRIFPDYFNDIAVSFSQSFIAGDADWIDNGSISVANRDTYPSEVGQKMGSCNLRPIQVNVLNFLRESNTPGVYFVQNSRYSVLQASIEFDLQLDPDLLNPRIIPIVVNGEIDSVELPPSTANYKVSNEAFLPYEQLAI